MLRYLTSGESHGQSLISILDGVPSNIELNIDESNFKGTKELLFAIAPKELNNSMLLNIEDVYYNGTSQLANIELVYNSILNKPLQDLCLNLYG